MMFIDKEEVEGKGQKSNEPTAGVPIKKRPFNLNGPSFLQSDTHSLDKLSLTPKHVSTPKSLLDFGSSSHFSNCNKIGSNAEKPSASSNTLGLEIPQVTIAPAGAVKQEKLDNCSTDLSLTGNCSSSSSKVQTESLNCSGRRAALDLNVDLNVPIETWDSTTDFAVENNRVLQKEPVQPLVKQVSRVNMKCNGNIPTSSSKNIDKPSDKNSLGEVTLDLQLKLPSRPELRMKNCELVWSSDLSLSLSGKDLDNDTPKSKNPKSQLVEKGKETSVNNVNVKPAGQKEVIVKKESHEGNLKEKVGQESGSKDQNNLVKKEPVDNNASHESQLLGGKLLEKSSNKGIDLNQTASCSNPAVTVPVGLVVQPALTQSNKGVVPVGGLVVPPAVTKSNMSAPLGGLVASPAVTKSNTSVPLGGLVAPPAVTKSNATLPVGSLVDQPSIPKSNQSHNNNNSGCATISTTARQNASSLVPTSLSLVGNSSHVAGTEDIKPVISSISVPAIAVSNAKQTVPMASEGMSQGSADMECSEENHNLPKLTTAEKSNDRLVNSHLNQNNLHESCSSKIPKLETDIVATENIAKSSIPLTVPSSNELNCGHNSENHDNNGLAGGDKNEMPSNCTHLRPMNILALSHKTKQSLEVDGRGSKSRSPSISGKHDSSNSRHDTSDRENGFERESGMEREIGSSSRQFVGEGSNSQFHRQFKRNDSGFDRPSFERKKSRVSQWDEGSNNRSNRYDGGQRWEGRKFNKFDNDRFEDQNGEAGFRPGSNNRNIPNIRYKNNNNRFNYRGKSRGGFRFTRQNNNDSDMPFPDEANEGRRRPGARPCISRFQSRRRLADVGPREADEMDPPVFDHPNNHNHYNNKRVDHAVMCSRDRSFSPVPRRNSHHWTPPVGMITGHNEVLTRVRSPPGLNRRPYYNNKDCTIQRHLSNNRPLNRNNSRRFVGPASGKHFEPMHFDGDDVVHFHHVRYCSDDDDGAFSDGGAPHVRGRNRDNNSNNNNNGMRRQGGDQNEYRYNNRGGLHGWRDGNNANNNGDKLKRRRY